MPLLNESNKCLDKQHYPAYESYSNETRQRVYYQKLLAYYGGTFPLDYYQRVNRGLEAQRKLKAYWRERERLHRHLNLALLALLMI